MLETKITDWKYGVKVFFTSDVELANADLEQLPSVHVSSKPEAVDVLGQVFDLAKDLIKYLETVNTSCNEEAGKNALINDFIDHVQQNPETVFKNGDQVRKVKSYSFDGYVIGTVFNSQGQERIIVEFKDHIDKGRAGMLHIFNTSQMEKV